MVIGGYSRPKSAISYDHNITASPRNDARRLGPDKSGPQLSLPTRRSQVPEGRPDHSSDISATNPRVLESAGASPELGPTAYLPDLKSYRARQRTGAATTCRIYRSCPRRCEPEQKHLSDVPMDRLGCVIGIMNDGMPPIEAYDCYRRDLRCYSLGNRIQESPVLELTNGAEEWQPAYKCLIRLQFGMAGNAANFQRNGWSGPESGYTFSLGIRSSVDLTSANIRPSGSCILEILAKPFTDARGLPHQSLSVGQTASASDMPYV